MNNLPINDRKLIDELAHINAKIFIEKENLYAKREGCACNGRDLCAHHAQVWNDLDEISKAVTKAIRNASE